MAEELIRELVCTRLSHDIIGNIGAVANAVELLEEGDIDFLGDIRSILKNSSQTLSARLKFFRMTFGLSNANLDNPDIVRQTAQDYLLTLGNKDYPITLSFAVNTAEKRKSALLMIMIMADFLIRGGTLSVYEEQNLLIAEIDASAKLAAEKLEKAVSALNNREIIPDAGLAPLYALRTQNQQSSIRFGTTEQSIRLILEN